MTSTEFYRGRKVLVAGGTGTIGIPLVKELVARKARVYVISMDSAEFARKVLPREAEFTRMDLTDFDNCLAATDGIDFVFNLVGIKGSVGIGQTKVASYFYPMLLFQAHLMEAAFRNAVRRYLFVSSICAYPQSDQPKKEDQIWNGMPKQNDRIPGLAKRMAEIQGETYLLEHNWDAVRIVRPANVFGPYDDFNPDTAQVVPALIARMVGGENPVRVWGDGTAVRDFIYSDECAHWLAVALAEAPPCVPINLGGGQPVSIKEVAETIAGCLQKAPAIEWDTEKPTGDPVRVLDMQRARDHLQFQARISFQQAIGRTIDWYCRHQDLASLKGERYYGV